MASRVRSSLMVHMLFRLLPLVEMRESVYFFFFFAFWIISWGKLVSVYEGGMENSKIGIIMQNILQGL